MSDKPTTTCPGGDACRLTAELNTLKKEIIRLSELVSTDPLTGLFNYRHFIRHLKQEIERSQRTLQATSLIMLDVDHFKLVNDQWGHEIGNKALQLIATCIINNVRRLDIACRYGGEEFAVILPSSNIATSVRVAERIRYSIEKTPLFIYLSEGDEESITLTASAGLSMYSGNQAFTGQQLVAAADEQLYKSKKAGRNQISFVVAETDKQQVSREEKTALLDRFNDNFHKEIQDE